MGERKFVQMVRVTSPRWSPCLYFKIFSRRQMTLAHGMWHLGCEAYQVCPNNDPRLTLAYLQHQVASKYIKWGKLKGRTFENFWRSSHYMMI